MAQIPTFEKHIIWCWEFPLEACCGHQARWPLAATRLRGTVHVNIVLQLWQSCCHGVNVVLVSLLACHQPIILGCEVQPGPENWHLLTSFMLSPEVTRVASP